MVVVVEVEVVVVVVVVVDDVVVVVVEHGIVTSVSEDMVLSPVASHGSVDERSICCACSIARLDDALKSRSGSHSEAAAVADEEDAAGAFGAAFEELSAELDVADAVDTP